MPDDPKPRSLWKLTWRLAFPDRDGNGVKWEADVGLIGVDRPDQYRFILFQPFFLDVNLDAPSEGTAWWKMHWSHVHVLGLYLFNWKLWILGAKDTN